MRCLNLNFGVRIAAALLGSALLVGCADEGVDPAPSADGVEVDVETGDDALSPDGTRDGALDVDVDADGVNVDVGEDGVNVDVDE